MGRKICRQLLALVLISFFIAFLLPRETRAITLVVDPDNPDGCLTTDVTPCYTTISAAITAAVDDDTIEVRPRANNAAYAGNLTIDKNISLLGTETARTIVSGGGGTAITVSGADVFVNIQRITFTNAQYGIDITETAAVSASNNIFRLGTGGTAIRIQSLSDTLSDIINNVFYNNAAGIQSTRLAFIQNNIFYGNSIAIDSTDTTTSYISQNCFYDNSQDGRIGDSTTNVTEDPLFVSPTTADFHLKEDSPCIDTGNTRSVFNDPPFYPNVRNDMGAYGGPQTDTIPFKVSGLSGTGQAPDYVVRLTWTPNDCYLVAGYNVYYDVEPNMRTKRADVGDVLSFPYTLTLDLTGLTLPTPPLPSDIPPPSSVTANPLNQRLQVLWSPVIITSTNEPASGYKVHYGISPATDTVVDVGSTTSTDLISLTNGVTYSIAVSAYWQAPFYFSVTAYYTPDTPSQESSEYSNEAIIPTGPQTEGAASAPPIEATPEELIAYPPLPDEGCFIATAAYGSYSAAQVKVLRDFRDDYLLKTVFGKTLVQWYYQYGPTGARFLNQHPWLKPVARVALLPAVGGAALMTRGSGAAVIFIYALSAMILTYILLRSSRQQPD